MSDEPSTDPFKQVVYGIAAAASLSYFGWIGIELMSLADRMTRIETTILEYRDERQRQVDDLRNRIERLENRIYGYGRTDAKD